MKPKFRLLEFPSGVPYLSGHYGIDVREKGYYEIPLMHNDWDLWFVDEGKVTWEFQDGSPLTLEKNHFYLFPPYVSVARKPLTARFKLWFCHFDFQEIPACAFYSFRKDCLELERKIFIPMSFTKAGAPGVWRAFRDLLALGWDVPLGRLKMDAQGRELLTWPLHGLPWKTARAHMLLVSELAQHALQLKLNEKDGTILGPADALHPRLEAFVREIHSRLDHQWETADLARILGLSVRQADRIFRALVGQSMKKYIAAARLRRAASLLKQPRRGDFLPLKEISAMCGYSSQQHFSNQFKKSTGFTPLEYRSSPYGN